MEEVVLSTAVVFEDAVADVGATRAGGMRCIAATFVARQPVEKLRAAGADLVVGSLDEVIGEQIVTMVG